MYRGGPLTKLNDARWVANVCLCLTHVYSSQVGTVLTAVLSCTIRWSRCFVGLMDSEHNLQINYSTDQVRSDTSSTDRGSPSVRYITYERWAARCVILHQTLKKTGLVVVYGTGTGWDVTATGRASEVAPVVLTLSRIPAHANQPTHPPT